MFADDRPSPQADPRRPLQACSRGMHGRDEQIHRHADTQRYNDDNSLLLRLAMWRNNTVIGESVSRKFIMHTLSCTRSRKHNTCVQKRKQKDTQQCSRKRVQQLKKT